MTGPLMLLMPAPDARCRYLILPCASSSSTPRPPASTRSRATASSSWPRLEVVDRRATGRTVHFHVDPERDIDAGATEVHGMTWEDLKGKPKFRDVAADFVDFARGAQWVIHNAPFDVAFLDAEFALGRHVPVRGDPRRGSSTRWRSRASSSRASATISMRCASASAIDNAQRTLHGALLDAELLAEVYLAMTRGQETLTIDIAAPALLAEAAVPRAARCRPREPRAAKRDRADGRGARRARRLSRCAGRGDRGAVHLAAPRVARPNWRRRARRGRHPRMADGQRHASGNAPVTMDGHTAASPLPTRPLAAAAARAAIRAGEPDGRRRHRVPLNRELSLLAFNRRVLALAEDAAFRCSSGCASCASSAAISTSSSRSGCRE